MIYSAFLYKTLAIFLRMKKGGKKGILYASRVVKIGEGAMER
jgi:hypothetical protein